MTFTNLEKYLYSPKSARLFTVPYFPWDRRDRARLTVNGGHLDFQIYQVEPGGRVKVHLKIKIAAINGKTRSISTIPWKNRGL